MLLPREVLSQPWFHTRATGVNCLNVGIERERYDATSEREDWAQHFDVDGLVIMEAVLVGFEDILGSPLVPHPSSRIWILLSGCWTALLTWPCGVGSCLKISFMYPQSTVFSLPNQVVSSRFKATELVSRPQF